MKTILLVDDDALIRGIGEDALQALGYRTRTAVDGASALQAAEDRPSLVLLDENLPDMNGSAVLQALRARWPDLPVVLFSGSQCPAPSGLTQERWTAVLAKPFRMDDLAALLSRLLES
jgi:CheY-like chemotaxis protein